MRSLPLRFGWFSLLAAACSVSACGGSHDDISKRLATLQTDMTRLQSHSDRLEERLQVLEMRKDAAPAKTVTGESQPPGNGERPRLLVVKLEPGNDDARDAPAGAPTATLRPEDSAADNSPRPMIRVYGSRTDVDSGSDSPKRKR